MRLAWTPAAGMMQDRRRFRRTALSSSSRMSTQTPASETHSFQAEVAALLRLMVHSVYSESDIFLRELISNASDACDRLRYDAIARPELMADGAPLVIRLIPDAAAGTLTIADTGIGMDRQEMIDNLGTIARSGTRAFLDRLSQAKDGTGLIGQFGVGFYSAFMVADRIEVTSRRAGASEAWVWRSTGGEGFEVAPASEDAAARVVRGTEVVLHVKDEAKRYLAAAEIERIVRMYSDNILFPIELAAKEGAPRQINTASALWQRSKSELKREDYTQAYQTIAGAFDEPAMTLHYKVEGRQSYAVLLFAPAQSPFDLFEPDRKGRVKLYVRRVYITDDADLLAPYLRFVRGVIDSEDLPLNISREMLQNNPQVAQIRTAVTGRVLGELESLAARDAATFAKLWEAFGSVIKEGIYEDRERRDQLLTLARFATTRDAGLRSLKEYLADLKPNQTAIYYLVGDSLDRLKASPKLEAARARGVEVLLLTDHVDAFWTSMPLGFEGKPLKSLSQGDVDFGLVPLLEAETPEAKEEPNVVHDALTIAAVKSALGERVSDVRASQRLTDSAACLVAGGSAPDRELDRLLARQAGHVGSRPIPGDQHAPCAGQGLGRRRAHRSQRGRGGSRRGAVRPSADPGWRRARRSRRIRQAAQSPREQGLSRRLTRSSRRRSPGTRISGISGTQSGTRRRLEFRVSGSRLCALARSGRDDRWRGGDGSARQRPKCHPGIPRSGISGTRGAAALPPRGWLPLREPSPCAARRSRPAQSLRRPERHPYPRPSPDQAGTASPRPDRCRAAPAG
jgi:molecular chaperone HtpG